jgi:hypothetical protein
VRSIAFRTLIYMERKLARLNIAIRRKNIKKANNGKLDPKSIQIYKEAWNRGRMYGEQVWRARLSRRIKEIQYGKDAQKNKQKEVVEILQSKRDRA